MQRHRNRSISPFTRLHARERLCDQIKHDACLRCLRLVVRPGSLYLFVPSLPAKGVRGCYSSLCGFPSFCNFITKLFGNLMGCFITMLLAGVPLHRDSGGEVNRNCVSWWFIVRFLGISQETPGGRLGNEQRSCTTTFTIGVG